jgi:hypothetical protein
VCNMLIVSLRLLNFPAARCLEVEREHPHPAKAKAEGLEGPNSRVVSLSVLEYVLC